MVNNQKPSANILSASEVTAIVKKIAAGVIADSERYPLGTIILNKDTSELFRKYPWSVVEDGLGLFSITVKPGLLCYKNRVVLLS